MQMPEKAKPTENNQMQSADAIDKAQQAKEWLLENRDAIAEYNQFVEQFGVFNAARPFTKRG